MLSADGASTRVGKRTHNNPYRLSPCEGVDLKKSGEAPESVLPQRGTRKMPSRPSRPGLAHAGEAFGIRA